MTTIGMIPAGGKDMVTTSVTLYNTSIIEFEFGSPVRALVSYINHRQRVPTLFAAKAGSWTGA